MKKTAPLLLSFIWAFVLIGCQSIPVAEGQTTSSHSKYSEHANAFMVQSVIPGMAIAIYKKGEIIYAEGLGYADVEQEIPVDPYKTKFRIASISKTVSADALAQLVEAGKLDLDLEVQAYLPDFPKKRWPLTTRAVAGHIGGVRHYRGNENLSTEHFPTVKDGLEIFKDDPLLFEPGTKYSYSSYGFNLVSAVIEGASGESFLDYMQTNVFDKLGMTNTQAEFMDQIIKNRGRYYWRSEEGIINAPFVDNSYKWAGGGFLSTAEDLIKFGKAHITTGYLSPESMNMLTTSQKLSDGTETGYGLGWRTEIDNKGYHWIGHTGGAVGGTCKIAIYPKEDIIVVVLTNITSARYGDLTHELAWLAMED